MSDHLDDVDRLAAALAGYRAAGLIDQPFEMAKLLVEQGWKLGPPPGLGTFKRPHERRAELLAEVDRIREQWDTTKDHRR